MVQKCFANIILFVLLFGLDISDVDMLDTLAFQADQIDEILRKTEVDPQFRKLKSTKGKNRGTSLKQILDSHENANEE